MKRDFIEETNFILPRVLEQLESMDLKSPIECPLINGGCGLGKTTAITSPEVYALLSRKLGRPARVLITESRSKTRDQQRYNNLNPNIHIEQYQATAKNLEQLNNLYDIIVIDECHSLFGDSEFDAGVTMSICQWLKNNCKLFQIYITASDMEFITYAEEFQFKKEFHLTFPDMREAHARYAAQTMVLSINADSTTKVLQRKEKLFFKHGNRGIFFIWSARDAYALYEYYSQAGFRCGFYISQQNNSYIANEKNLALIEDNEAEDNLFAYTSVTYTVSVPIAYQRMEAARKTANLQTISDALTQGTIPDDIEFLFLTNVGQEGISISSTTNLNFIFIEDTCPMTINQKIFRYRGNIPLAFISLPRKRLEKLYQNALSKVYEMTKWPQEKLEGYYLAAKENKFLKNSYARLIWFNPDKQVYEVGGNVVAQLITKSKQFRFIQDNIKDEEKLQEFFGTYARTFKIENSKEEFIKEKIFDIMKEFENVFLYKAEQELIVKKCQEAGLTNNHGKNYKFSFVKKFCEENNICFFESKRQKINGKIVKGWILKF